MRGRGRHASLWSAGLVVALGLGACAANDASSAPVGQADASVDRPGSATGGSGGAGAPATGGSAASGSGGFFGSGGAVGAGGSSAGSGGAGGAVVAGCAVELSLQQPQSEANLFSGSKARARVGAVLSRPGPKTAIWRWAVEFQQTLNPAPVLATAMTDPIQPGMATVDFPILLTGHYKVSVTVDTGVICSKSLNLTVSDPKPASYIVRVTPPLLPDLQVPTQDTRIVLKTGMFDQNPITLRRGTRRSVSTQAPDGSFIPAYMRASVVPSGVALEIYALRGPIDLLSLPNTTYDLLIVPDGDVAPLRLSASWDTSLLDNKYNPVRMDQGTAVHGALLNSDGSGIVGARIVLRDGIVPSTIGVSDAAGRFSLWARPGMLAATAVPPAAVGLAEAHIPAAPGIAVDASMSDFTMTWQPVVRGALVVMVKTVDGLAPAVGARVRLEPQPDAEKTVAFLRVTGATVTTLAATGALRADAITDGAGVARFGKVPEGAYKLTVVPPSAMPEAALTTRSVTLTSVGLTETVPLARHLLLTGRLLPTGRTKGVRVIARDQSAGVAAPLAVAVADAMGGYSLSLDPDRIYTLTADPPAGSMLARAVLGNKNSPSVDGSAPDYTVPPAVSVSGLVTVEGTNLPVNGAVVQVYCEGTALNCADPDSALAETVTDQTGSFTVALPDPQIPVR